MGDDSEHLYLAVKAHDARFDGRVFVGVSSTGIYCRPVCRVKTPNRENCRFYPSAAAAEQAGYRPCLRCRPEQAPTTAWGGAVALVDAPRRLALRAAQLIEESGLSDSSLVECAASLGVTDRHLRRTFLAEFGVPPVQYLQTQRLLLAKGLLTDTALPVTTVAMAAGFGSVRRFNTLFKDRYRLSPTAIRKARPAAGAGAAGAAFVCELSYRPPYAWAEVLAFLAHRGIPGVESVADGSYRRTIGLAGAGEPHRGWIEVRQAPRRDALRVTVSPSLARVLPRVLSRVRALFDLACDPVAVAAQLGPLAAKHPGLRVPGAVDGFEMAVRAVLGQQVTTTAARTLAARFAAELGSEPDVKERAAFPLGLDRFFPSAAEVAAASAERIGKLGIVRQRVGAIQEIARLVASGGLVLAPTAPVEEALAKLQEIPGIGPWTAEYVGMRALAWPDAFPRGDWGIKKALGEDSPARLERRAERWRPWRSYAVLHLWHSLAKGSP
jgi:AraC family transcriptional regulator of adaptative response / DNA-3-methyladenine glycosylase II